MRIIIGKRLKGVYCIRWRCSCCFCILHPLAVLLLFLYIASVGGALVVSVYWWWLKIPPSIKLYQLKYGPYWVKLRYPMHCMNSTHFVGALFLPQQLNWHVVEPIHINKCKAIHLNGNLIIWPGNASLLDISEAQLFLNLWLTNTKNFILLQR